MMALIIRKQLKELASGKSNLVLIGIIIAICGIVSPIFSPIYFTIFSPLLALMFLAQISPGLFVDEKDNHTLETLVTLPISIKKIIYGKVLYGFLLTLFLFLCSFGLGFVVSMIAHHSVIFTWKQVIGYILMIPFTFWAFAYQATYMSLKSNDSGACALTLSFVSVIYNIPAIVILVFILAPIDTALHFLGFSLAVNLLNVACLYFVLVIAVCIALRILLGRYFNKTTIFSLLRN